MKVEIYQYLRSVYRPWGGAKAVWERMTDEELILIECWFDEEARTYTETEINDFFWFEDETWLEIINETEEKFYKRPKQRELN